MSNPIDIIVRDTLENILALHPEFSNPFEYQSINPSVYRVNTPTTYTPSGLAILKFAIGKKYYPSIGDSLDFYPHIANEVEILRHLNGVAGVPQVLEEINGYYYRGFTKTYIDGDTLEGDERITSPRLQQQLRDKLTQIHDRGVAIVDIKHWNIIVSNSGLEASFFDFGNATLLRKYKSAQRVIERDFKDLEHYVFKPKPRYSDDLQELFDGLDD